MRPHSIWRRLPSPPRRQQLIDGYQLDLLMQAVPIRAAGQTTEQPHLHIVRHRRGMKRNRKPPEQTTGVSGGRCGCSTDGGGCVTERRHNGSTAGRLNKCADAQEVIVPPRARPYSLLSCVSGLSEGLSTLSRTNGATNTSGQSMRRLTDTTGRQLKELLLAEGRPLTF